MRVHRPPPLLSSGPANSCLEQQPSSPGHWAIGVLLITSCRSEQSTTTTQQHLRRPYTSDRHSGLAAASHCRASVQAKRPGGIGAQRDCASQTIEPFVIRIVSNKSAAKRASSCFTQTDSAVDEEAAPQLLGTAARTKSRHRRALKPSASSWFSPELRSR